MSPEASKFLEYLDRAISEQKAAILRGAVGGVTSEQVAVNYKASTMQLTNFERIRVEFVDTFTKKQADEDGDGLQQMPDEDGK
jgi:hypothetical protein